MMMPRSWDQLPPAVITPSHRSNNFDLIRLIAALQVVIAHAIGHTALLDTLSGWQRTAFDWFLEFPGVPVFFVISGFLIARSYERSRDDPAGYAWRRCLRIFPALWVCLIVTIAVLAGFGFLTGGFVASSTFWGWLAGQATFVQFFNPEQFRDFGIGVANGALWTITVELQFYVFVPLLYATFLGKWRGTAANLLMAGIFAVSFLIYCRMDMEMNGPGGYAGTPMLWKLVFVTLAPHLWMFFLGIAIHRNFESLAQWLEGKFVPYLAAYVILLVISGMWLPDHSVAFYALHLPTRIVLALATISAAYSARGLAGRLLGGTDVSYGVYIYHSIVINVLVELGQMRSLLSVVWVIFITGILAWVSWTFIEKPALSHKADPLSGLWKRVSRRARALPE